jgi:hypothetical protein
MLFECFQIARVVINDVFVCVKVEITILVVVACIDMDNCNILEEHVISDESININDVAIQWEAHSTSIENSIAISNILVLIVAVVDANSIAILAPDILLVHNADISIE